VVECGVTDVCQVRMQTTNVAYRTSMEVHLALVFSFSEKAAFFMSVLGYGGVSSALGSIID